MDRLAVEKETARAQLSSAENQLQIIKEKISVQARKIEELEARLASELAKAKSDAEKAKANANTFVAIYRADTEATQVQARKASEIAKTRAYWDVELAKCQSRRVTLEEIYAQDFDLTEEIKRAKELEDDAEALASNDDDDDDGSKSLGKYVFMRPLSGEEEISIPAPKPAKDKKRKNTSTSEDPGPKKKADRKPKKNIILLTEDFVQRLREEDEKEEENNSGPVARVGMSIEAPKATESVKAAKTPSRDEGVSGKDLGEVPESSRIEYASHHNEPIVGTVVGAGLEALRDGENPPSDLLGAIEIGGSPLLPSFSEEMIQEAWALKTLSIEGGHGMEDPFRDYFTGAEDATGVSDLEDSRKDSGEASSLFNEAQQALNRASALHQEVFSQS
ncbi:uncharacterized protein [Nicotiana tomentosiformis]|uniref:uncharacterized protein n=1 Tax=Nicotiana tomentosiformis TaxID=4098 RepID=UPI00388C7CE3